MTKQALYIAAGVLILLSLIVLNIGLNNGTRWLWIAGLAALTLAMALSLATRWVGGGEEEDQQSGKEQP